MVTFIVPTANLFFDQLGPALLIAGLMALAIGIVLFLFNNTGERKGRTATRGEESHDRVRITRTSSGGSHVPALIAALILLIVGVSFTVVHSTNSLIIIEKGSFTVSGRYIGNNTYNSSDIKYAFVENMQAGNISFSHKIIGTASSSVDEGRFALSNGATADVVSVNHTDLIVELTSGKYLVLGASNMTSLETAFSTNVYDLGSGS